MDSERAAVSSAEAIFGPASASETLEHDSAYPARSARDFDRGTPLLSMCGIAGIVGSGVRPEILANMLASEAHRGPDGERQVIRGGLVGLGHRRLAIIDLSDAASQPMRSPSGCEVVLNGEIYNYLELRDELRSGGATFQTASDTEVLLAAYDRWGTDCLSHLNGMFAFAIYDPNWRELMLARDRLGEKPLYYTSAPDGSFLFASEIKALLAHPEVAARADPAAVYRFLRRKQIEREPSTFFAAIHALPPGHVLSCGIDDRRQVLERYWSLEPSVSEPVAESELIAQYRELLGDAISIRLRADVPVGSSLSGGIDSSAIVGYLALGLQIANQHTFSARFPSWALDEGRFIGQVTRLAATSSHEVQPIPTPSDLERVVWHQDQPFASLSVYAQWAVMRLVRDNQVTVLLDGQGADETVAGYHFYFAALFRELVNKGRWLDLVRELHGYARLHGVRQLRRLGFYALPHPAASLLRGLRRGPGIASDSHLDQALALTMTDTMLPGLLRYADRNSMAFGREVRLPYLDYRLLELAFRLPAALKLHRGWTKRILREAMSEYLPVDVRLRKDKVGYAPPEAEWLRGPLREWSADLLYSPAFGEREWNDAEAVRKMWRAFLAGDGRHQADLWRFLSVEAWARRFLDAAPS
jgi:asparagine synthase (glutamine-hydrolysing)